MCVCVGTKAGARRFFDPDNQYHTHTHARRVCVGAGLMVQKTPLVYCKASPSASQSLPSLSSICLIERPIPIDIMCCFGCLGDTLFV